MENLIRLYNNKLKPMFGVLILLNILDQILLSGSLIPKNLFLEIFYAISMVLFILELFLRIASEKKITVLYIYHSPYMQAVLLTRL